MRATLGLAVAGIAGFGAFIFYNTNVLHEYVRPPEAGQRAAEYEKRYAQFATLPQPTIVDAALRIEIYPERLAAECSGSFGLVNRTGQPIGQIHVSTSRDAITRSLSLDRACVTEVQDDEVGYRIFRLEEPLPPGGTVRLAFSCEFSPRGFANSRHPTEVVANGAHFHRGMMPTVGYQPALEVAGNLERQRLGLSARPPAPGPDDQEARRERWALRDADLVHVDAVIGTAEDQIAVTPGELQGTWSENGRRYFHYRTRTPVAFGGTVFSARYAVREDRWNDVALQIFHHPGHEANLDRMMSAMKASLEYFTAEFGPYPYRQARIVEFPRYGGFGHAHPETIGFSEDAFLSRVMENEADQPFYGVAHEMAHTWWGGLVRGGRVRGAEFLSESLANYSAMMVVEQVYGREAARKVYGFQKERYLQGRADQGHEVPLLYVEDQPYIAYRKGAIVLYQLRERLGAEAVNAALRRYLEKFVDAGPPYPSSLDLYAELRGAVPAELHSWLADLFEAITLWDVATAGASATRNEAGGYDVTIEVVAEKVRADVNGAETPAKVNEWIDVGLFAAGEGGALGEALYLQPHRIRGGRQTVRVTIGAAPAYAGVDPYRMVIERNGADNVVAVAVRGGETVGW
jgi:ABC-2 type transport system permease protein